MQVNDTKEAQLKNVCISIHIPGADVTVTFLVIVTTWKCCWNKQLPLRDTLRPFTKVKE